MRQSRVYTPQKLLAANSVELTGSVAHYLARVLRMTEGNTVTLFNGDGKDHVAVIENIQRQSVQVKLLSSHTPANESEIKITLVQAISRGERMEYCLQKATELGVHSIQLVNTRRVEVRLDEKRLAKRLAHWRGVIISACEQSGRAVIPEVRAPVSMKQWLAVTDDSERLVLDPRSENSLSGRKYQISKISILVGPEGGFSEEEMSQLHSSEVVPVSLGPRVLRTETAGPAAIAVIQAMAGDL